MLVTPDERIASCWRIKASATYPDGELTATTQPDGSELKSSYGPDANLIAQTNTAGKTTTYV